MRDLPLAASATFLAAAAAVVVLPAAGCLGLDLLGKQAIVSEHEESSKDTRPQDDRIEDKHPVYDPARTTVEIIDGCEVTLNKSATVTKLDIPELAEDEQALDGVLFRGRAEAIAAVAAIPGADLIPSMEVVNGRLKPFNDGLYAAVELAVQDGVPGAFPGKRQLLVDLVAALDARRAGAGATAQEHLSAAIVFLGAALLAAGEEPAPALPPDLAPAARAVADAFLADALRSRPIGFYTWSPRLEAVFRQDRLLQNQGGDASAGEFGRFAAIAVVLEEEPELRAAYERVAAIPRGLTARFAAYTPLDLLDWVEGVASLEAVASLAPQFIDAHPALSLCPVAYLAFLPSSWAKDNEYLGGLFCDSMPAGTSVIDVLVEAIRSGALDLAPGDDAGWYDWQLHALETLLLPERGPESDHLLLTAAYKEKLIETFQSLITQTRETHVKQIGGFGMGAAPEPHPVEVYPLFPLEPFPTYYLRSARAYRFLQSFLPAALGEEVLGSLGRVGEDGTPSSTPLAEELDGNAELLYGLYALSAAAVGMDPVAHLLEGETAALDLEACAARARTWLESWRADADVLSDPRVIVPVGVDPEGGSMVYWAVIGVRALPVAAEFVPGHEPEIVDPGANCEFEAFVPHRYVLLVERMEEVRIRLDRPPPTREELRAICDAHDTAEEVVAALEAL